MDERERWIEGGVYMKGEVSVLNLSWPFGVVLGLDNIGQGFIAVKGSSCTLLYSTVLYCTNTLTVSCKTPEYFIVYRIYFIY